MFPRHQRAVRDAVVSRRVRADDHGLDPVLLQRAVELRRQMDPWKSSGNFLEAFLPLVAHADDARFRQLAVHAHVVHAPVPASHDSDA